MQFLPGCLEYNTCQILGAMKYFFCPPKSFQKQLKRSIKKNYFRKSSHIWGPLPTKQLQPPFYVWVLINLYICSLCELTGFALMLSRLLTVGYFFAQKL